MTEPAQSIAERFARKIAPAEVRVEGKTQIFPDAWYVEFYGKGHEGLTERVRDYMAGWREGCKQSEDRLQIALGALADICNSDDMRLKMARHKANRIYEQLVDGGKPQC